MTTPTAGSPPGDLADLAIRQPGQVFLAQAASYYSRYREGYPDDLFRHLAEQVGLDRSHRALDLGCGGGQVTLPIARLAGHVTGLDPSAAMLAEARAAAAAAGQDRIDWVHARSEDLASLDLGPVDLVTAGRSFHWMDRPQVLAALDAIVAPDGALALMGVGPDGDDPAPWQPVIDGIRRRYLGPDPHPWRADPTTSNDAVLARSPFSRFESRTWRFEVERDVAEVVGVTFSYSISTPERFGDRADDFAAELRAALVAAEPSGRFRSWSRASLTIARRP